MASIALTQVQRPSYFHKCNFISALLVTRLFDFDYVLQKHQGAACNILSKRFNKLIHSLRKSLFSQEKKKQQKISELIILRWKKLTYFELRKDLAHYGQFFARTELVSRLGSIWNYYYNKETAGMMFAKMINRTLIMTIKG